MSGERRVPERADTRFSNMGNVDPLDQRCSSGSTCLSGNIENFVGISLEVYFGDYPMVEMTQCSKVLPVGISQSNVSQSEKEVDQPLEEKSIKAVENENENVNKEPCTDAINTRARAWRKINTERKTVLSWMIRIGIIQPHQRVTYTNHKRKHSLLSGDLMRNGILCHCCHQVVSILEFEAHSWKQVSDPLDNTNESDPLNNICLNSGRSLLQCMIKSWNKQGESIGKFYYKVRVSKDDQNDFVCSLCAKHGDLVCCDTCPSAFHLSCLDIQTLPSGDWHCIYCCCKFCGLYSGQKTGNYEGFVQPKSSSCIICEQKYHQSCLEASGVNTAHFKQSSLCGNECKVIYERLEMLIGVKHQIKDGFSWSFICRSDVDYNNSQIEACMIECNAKLAVALSVMKEVFSPCIDDGSGIDLIHSALYNCGSNFPRVDCKRFITAILEKDDEIISVASIRIHGNQLAEMPFVATRSVYRQKGMFTRLLKAIESTLNFLNVELLIVPAIQQARDIWTCKFGFETLDLRNKDMIKSKSLLVIPGTEILQKKIAKVSNLKRSPNRRCRKQ